MNIVVLLLVKSFYSVPVSRIYCNFNGGYPLPFLYDGYRSCNCYIIHSDFLWYQIRVSFIFLLKY